MEKTSCPKSIFFCGGSWGCVVYIGIYKAIIERWGKECLDKIKFGGNSSGAMVATLFALGIDIQGAEEIYKFLANKAKNEGVFMKMSNYHIEALNKVFKNGDEYKRLNNRLFIGVTYYFNDYKVISEWESNSDLLDTLHASFHIPFYCNYTKKTKYGIGIDGCVGRNYHMIDKDTIIIGCKTKQADIICNPPIKFSDCITPFIDNYDEIFSKGYNTMMKWDGKVNNNKLNETTKSKMLIMLLWCLRYMEELSIYSIIKNIKFYVKNILTYLLKKFD